MELLELMKYRRSIRKYEDKQISREDLEKVIDAGLFAPNAGGGQRSMIVAVRNPETVEKLGRLNVACMDRSHLLGSHLSSCCFLSAVPSGRKKWAIWSFSNR